MTGLCVMGRPYQRGSLDVRAQWQYDCHMRLPEPPLPDYGLAHPPQAMAGWASLLLFLAGMIPAGLWLADRLLDWDVLRGSAVLLAGLTWASVVLLLPAGIAFGIVGLCRQHRRREAALIGLVLNSLVFGIILAVFA